MLASYRGTYDYTLSSTGPYSRFGRLMLGPLATYLGSSGFKVRVPELDHPKLALGSSGLKAREPEDSTHKVDLASHGLKTPEIRSRQARTCSVWGVK
jgi:hypothetical protein